MGMFDSVYASCPYCNNQVELQSKVGDCILASFSENSIPVAIGVDINNKPAYCINCSNVSTFSLNGIVDIVSGKLVK